MNCGLRVRLAEITSSLQGEWSRIDQLWQEGLRSFGGPFLAGPHFTAVDAFFAPLAFRTQTYSPNLSKDANGYVNRLLQLPAMKSWYDAALLEPWRDEEHEQEARAAGEWIADLRTPTLNTA